MASGWEESMPQRQALAIIFVAALFLETVGCSMSSSMSNRVLQSMTVSPATADAQNFANGQVQFSATGTFSKPPSPAAVPFVAPYSGSWLADTSVVTLVGTSGNTATFQCVAGASGTITITAIASSNSANGPAMSTAVTGTATLTCP
jgi:hypothetical protein